MSDKIDRPVRFLQKSAQILTQRMREGSLRLGESLPTKKQLSDKMGLIETIISESISTLKTSGFIGSKQDIGAYASKTSEPGSFSTYSNDLGNKKYLGSLFELRMYIESSAAELAAANRTDNHVRRMKEALDVMENEINAGSPDSESSIIADINFHKTLVDATNNSCFQQLIIFLDENFRITIKKGRANSAKVKNIPEKVLKEHTCIYKAIVNKDITVANSAMRRHILNSANRLNLTIGTADANCYSRVTDGLV